MNLIISIVWGDVLANYFILENINGCTNSAFYEYFLQKLDIIREQLPTFNSQECENSTKIPNFILYNIKKQMVTCESTESTEWSHHRIWSTDSKVRSALHISIINSRSGRNNLCDQLAYSAGYSLGLAGLCTAVKSFVKQTLRRTIHFRCQLS